MYDLFMRAQWFELYNYFASGNPPLILQLLVLNTIFFVWLIIKRLRGQHVPKMRLTSFHMQELLIFANVLVLMQGQYLPFLQQRVMPVVDHVQRML